MNPPTANALRYAAIKRQASLAHWLVRLARRIMPAGHGRGVFETPAEDMREDLARYGLMLSRAQTDVTLARARLAAVALVYDEMREAKNFAAADALRCALSTAPGARSLRLQAVYEERFDKPHIPFVTTPIPKPTATEGETL